MTARRYHPLRVAAVTPETDEAVVIRFDTADALAAFKTFRPGQHLNIRATLAGADIRRSYSVCAPVGGALQVLVKSVPNGVFSNYARTQLRTGDSLQVMPPAGDFGAGINYGEQPRILALAAGSGITPVISILETALAGGGEGALLYGSRGAAAILFRDRLADLKDTHLRRFVLSHALSREKNDNPLSDGRLDAEKYRRFFTVCQAHRFDHILLCGPAPMMDAAQEALAATTTAAKSHREFFNAPAAEAAAVDRSSSEATADIRLDGARRRISVHAGETILQAARRNGLETPHSCEGGVCGTCRARLTHGTVKTETQYALEEKECAAGFILTCRARPTAAAVTVDFDA